MICFTCGHYSHPDGEMQRVQQSGDCACRCHPWNRTVLTCPVHVGVAEPCPECHAKIAAGL
jgi:hypothetical protein